MYLSVMVYARSHARDQGRSRPSENLYMSLCHCVTVSVYPCLLGRSTYLGKCHCVSVLSFAGMAERQRCGRNWPKLARELADDLPELVANCHETVTSKIKPEARPG